MAENCITFADMAVQKGDSKQQQKALQNILNDIRQRKNFIRSDSIFKQIMTTHHFNNLSFLQEWGLQIRLQ